MCQSPKWTKGFVAEENGVVKFSFNRMITIHNLLMIYNVVPSLNM